MAAPSVLGIIPTYGHFDYARRAGESFLAHTPVSHVLFVDDGSPGWASAALDRDWPEPGRVHIHRFPVNDRNLTRSWNYGLRLARELGCRYAVATNSDVWFPQGWWDCLAFALDHGVDLGVPLTNAPGHRSKQQVSKHLEGFQLSDDPDYLARAVVRLQERHGRKTNWPVDAVNGFCLAARTEVWWANSHDADHVFHPKYKMLRNEDEICGRWRKRGCVIAIVPGSLVFHYRGVTRGGAALRGTEAQGWYRIGGRPHRTARPIVRRLPARKVVRPRTVVVKKVRRRERPGKKKGKKK